MDSAQRGEVALKEGNPTAAIEYYTKALSSTPTSPVYYVKRSIAYHRTRDYESALVDAECSILAALKRGKRELIAEAQLRRAVTLAAMDRVQDAHICYELAHKYGYKGKDLEIHEAKLKTKRKGLDMQDPKMQRNVSDIPDRELPGAVTAPIKAKVSEDIEKDLPVHPKSTSPAPAPATAPTTTAASATAGSTTPVASIRHEWYQNNDNVFVTLFAKAVPKDRAIIEIQSTSLTISFPLSSGSDFDFSLDPLFAEIRAGDATSKIFGTKIEITLPKATPGIKWGGLEGTTSTRAPASAVQTAAPAPTQPSAGPANPYSTRGGQAKNWDKIVDSYQKPASSSRKADAEKTATEEEDEEEVRLADDDDEADGADFFFKKLFKGATPDQQRAMMKSYQESGGTSLSTNWDEVSKERVKVQPPEGMVEKKY